MIYIETYEHDVLNNDGGWPPNGRPCAHLSGIPWTQNQDQSIGRHSTNNRSYGHIRIVSSPPYDTIMIYIETNEQDALTVMVVGPQTVVHTLTYVEWAQHQDQAVKWLPFNQ